MSQSEEKTDTAQPEQKTNATSSQEEAASSLKKFQDLLRQLFQIEAADLDFGIYRILNYKREQVEEFINKRLPRIVNKAFQDYAKAEGMAQYQVTEDLKIRVYNDLYTFFSRYYEDGDFIAKRRYGRRETYAIPYNGEEVVLHWATKDQYYIKTGERFKNYRFKVKISTKDKDSTKVQDYTIAFELRSATTAQNNNKGEKRYFVLASDKPVAPGPEAKTITVFFEYRPLTDAEQKEFGRTEQQKPQDKLNKKAEEAILKQLQDLASKKPKNSEEQKELEALKAQLEKPEAENGKSQSGKSKAANGKSLLMKHLDRFTRRNTSDFFIHKNLRGFLRRELDFFIKSECLLLEELLEQKGNLTHQDILRARAVRDVGHQIIEFLAQVEDFQKRLFEKKKFVIKTHFCLTLDRIFAIEDDETRSWLLEQIIENDAQWDEWVQLFAIDKLEDSPLPKGEREAGEGQTQIKSRTKEERSALIKQFAREMRHAPTDAERRLWYFLRDRRLGGYKFRRQHPVGNYIADFACIEGRLIVELDGGQHAEIFQQEKDKVKTAFFTERGFRVSRFWNHQVLNDTQAVLEEILRVLEESPHPNPLPKGEREMAFLKAHPYLVIDTRHFSEDFKWRLLAHFDDLDEALDGLLIKSENFQALNLLMERYRGQVQCIYIDPPYNTGNDEFIYRDEYRHSSWLTMMDNRLALAKTFLNRFGAIFVSVDDNEQAHLRLLMDELYGQNNLITTMVWEGGLKNDSRFTSVSQDYIVSYVLDREQLASADRKWRTRKEGIDDIYREVEKLKKRHGSDWAAISSALKKWYRHLPKGHPALAHKHYSWVDEKGVYFPGDISWPGGGGPRYEVLHPITGKPVPVPQRGWVFAKPETMQQAIQEGRVHFGPDETSVPKLKRYLHETEGQVLPAVFYRDRRAAFKELRNILGDDGFANPKDPYILGKLIEASADNDAWILDFFAGSGTTAHAVINLNREDGGRRKYILVEMGDYFETVLLPRIKKVVYSDNWKDGKPQKGKGISHFFKYLYLEQYEDTLNNLELTRKGEGQLALERFGDEYLLRYMLKFETQGSPSLLNLKQFQDPFNYKLKVQEGDEIRARVVDLVETLNYLLGIHVKKMRQFQDNGRLYRAVLGEKRGKRIVIVWRPLNGLNGDTRALQQDRQFIQCTVIPALLGEGKKPDRLLVNGNCYVPGAESIELEFTSD
jgi:adenine-specific DNA-methyltransferase